MSSDAVGTAAAPTRQPPLVAFIVAGQCRASKVLGVGVSADAATRLFVQSHARFVHAGFEAPSTIFLLLKEQGAGGCGRGLCSLYAPTSCVEEQLDAGASACRTKLRHHKCFRQTVLSSWTPIWCTMWQTYARVERHELEHGLRHAKIVFSRVDQLYSSSMGPWHGYTQAWHSGSAVCHDMHWIMDRRTAACALNVHPVQMNCTAGQPCCNPRWHASWWPWTYCTNPRVRTGVTALYPVLGSFALETRRDGLRQCPGAPNFTYAGDADRPLLERRLTDQSGLRPFAYYGGFGV